MTRSEYHEYVELLKDMIKSKNHKNHSCLIAYLSKVGFFYTYDLDENRLIDGTSLRNRICAQYNFSFNYTGAPLITWLEVLVALAERCEAELAEYGQNNTDRWFWLMIDNMFGFNVSNANFNFTEVSVALNNIETHRKSLIFDRDDLASKEIWTQAMTILNDYIVKNPLK